MRVFNRIVVTLLLIGLVVLGVYGVIYSFQIAGYSLSNLEQTLGLSAVTSGIQSFLEGLGQGSLTAAVVAILVAVAVVGLVLLVLELKPRRPRHVRTSTKGVYMTRGAVGSAVQSTAESTTEVLGSKVKTKARRGAGAKIKLNASIRRGEDPGGVRSSIREQVLGGLANRGVPVGRLKLKLEETESQGAKARVQ